MKLTLRDQADATDMAFEALGKPGRVIVAGTAVQVVEAQNRDAREVVPLRSSAPKSMSDEFKGVTK